MRIIYYITITFTILVIATGFSQSQEKFSDAVLHIIEENPQSRIIAWIFFSDKETGLAEKLANVENALTLAAYQRRLRNRGAGELVDEFDIPVSSSYLQQISPFVWKIRHKSRWLNAVSVEAAGTALLEIAEFAFVLGIEEVVRYTRPEPLPADDVSPPQSALGKSFALDYGASFTQNNIMNVPLLHERGLSGEGVTIAVLDAGFNNLQHPAFDQMDIRASWDFVNNDENVDDQPGQQGSGSHGTNVLSCIGGFQEGQLIGPAFGATYLLAKTENTNSERRVEEDNWIAAAEWADSIGADIISSSVAYREFDPGEGGYTSEDMDGQTAIVTIGAELAASRGILVVNSIGNEGTPAPGENTLNAPADGANVLAVGAVNSLGQRAGFSSMGPSADGRIKPDVMAMGASVRMASSSGNGYTSRSGTSFSCPLTAGAAALILEANPGSTNQQIMGALLETADNAAAPNNSVGWGIIDALRASDFVATGGILPSFGDGLKILQNYPNPFNNFTTFQYNLPESADVKLVVYNIRGQKVETLVNRFQSAGGRTAIWSPENTASGIYIIALTANGESAGRKVVYVR